MPGPLQAQPLSLLLTAPGPTDGVGLVSGGQWDAAADAVGRRGDLGSEATDAQTSPGGPSTVVETTAPEVNTDAVSMLTA
ncbi:hypothetical protein GCM10010388_27820 [Streptomyces mauvecolor]